MVKRKAAAVLSFLLWAFLFLSMGYSARLRGGTIHQILLVMIAAVPWVCFTTWFSLKATVRPLIRTPVLFLVTVGEALWLDWSGVPLTQPAIVTLLIVTICTTVLLIPAISFFRQRRLILRFNAAYAAKEAGGSCADLLAEIEQCEAALKNCGGLDITYGGTPFQYMILLHKAALLREMGRKQESIALYQDVCPKIKDPEARKALLAEIDRLKAEWP